VITSVLTSDSATVNGANVPPARSMTTPGPPPVPPSVPSGGVTSNVASSLTIVPMPCGSSSVAKLGAERLSRNVSFGSITRSPRTTTVTVPVAWPTGIVRMPLVAR
jgi:hypothetical protein